MPPVDRRGRAASALAPLLLLGTAAVGAGWWTLAPPARPPEAVQPLYGLAALGVTAEAVDAQGGRPPGLIITSLADRGPGAAALRVGELIVSANGRRVRSAADLARIVDASRHRRVVLGVFEGDLAYQVAVPV